MLDKQNGPISSREGKRSVMHFVHVVQGESIRIAVEGIRRKYFGAEE